ncbi:winged helix-turn-helix domain-containing protein [Halolamina litorea]|uniref:Winged helix-turn-helix domain-containing protein n=1 Tax=Halolamina litorea TaxID=1515593 RepID=A0ABD6BSI4_9EURY|nr:helix-turn-helix domain-containing protein [Halolamina litorea]
MTGTAFTALGSEHRIEILRVLVEAVENDEPGLSFTELHDRTAIDSSSQFSYHLEELADVFVTESDGEYAPTSAGERVVRAIRSGIYAEEPSFEPTTVDGHCPECGETTLSAAYRERHLSVACADCGTTVVTYDLLPAEAEGRSSMETLRSCNRRVLREYDTAVAGTCPTCSGTTTATIDAGPDGEYACVATCDRCELRVYGPVELALFGHPAVIAFYWERGIDVTDLPLWRLPAFIGDAERHVVERDPLALKITLHHDGGTLTARIDDDGTVSLPDAYSTDFE